MKIPVRVWCELRGGRCRAGRRARGRVASRVLFAVPPRANILLESPSGVGYATGYVPRGWTTLSEFITTPLKFSIRHSIQRSIAL